MLDISNKLHALVDEFVSNLSSECASHLVNNISASKHMYVSPKAASEATKTPRSSNRTTTEVLAGLQRPSGNPTSDYFPKDGGSQPKHGKSSLQEGNTGNREEGRNSGSALDKNTRSNPVEWDGFDNDEEYLHIDLDNIAPTEGLQRGRGKTVASQKGKFMHSVELLSSDHSSDDGHRQNVKSPKKTRGKQSFKNGTISSARGRSVSTGPQSPSQSPESSHVLAYSYETDTNSHDARNPGVESTFPKPRKPEYVEQAIEGVRNAKDTRPRATHTNNESRHVSGRKNSKGDINPSEGDETNEEEDFQNEFGTESDDEELPVLPKVPVKRKLMSDSKGSERRSQRGKTKSTSTQIKKQRTPQIDASVITKLQFGRHPSNSVR